MPHIPVFMHSTGKWRPRWRGRVHGFAVAVTIPAGIILTLVTPAGIARFAVGVYALSLLALYSTSASYHLFTRSKRSQRTMQQVDHAMVYVLIAGSYTPVCLLALPRSVGVPFLLAIWAAAAVGMGLKISWKAKRVGHALYLIIGWAALIILPWAYHRAGFTSLLLYALGGTFTPLAPCCSTYKNQSSFRISSDFMRSGMCSLLLLASCSLRELAC